MRTFLFAFMVGLATACNFNSEPSGESPQSGPDSAAVAIDTIAVNYQGKDSLAGVTLCLLKLELRPADSVMQQIAQDFNKQALSLSAGSDFEYQSFTQRADSFVAERKRFEADFEGFKPAWDLMQNLKVVLNKNGVLGLNLQQQSYTGGAHPNHYSLYRYYRLRDGAVLEIGDFIPPENHAALLALTEKRFREEMELKPTESLTEAGFWFEEDRFKLAENFAYDGQTLSFVYNPYEVAPYAIGSIVVTLTQNDLQKLQSAEKLNI